MNIIYPDPEGGWGGSVWLVFASGLLQANIWSTFPAGVEPPLLAACSSHGSVHVFRLAAEDRAGSGGMAGSVGAVAVAASNMLSSLVKINTALMVSACTGMRMHAGTRPLAARVPSW